MAKNFIWTTLQAIFLIFRFFLHPQILKELYLGQILYKPNINVKLIYLNFRKLTRVVVQGHKCGLFFDSVELFLVFR